MSKKLYKKHAKIIQQVIQNQCQNGLKTFKKIIRKKKLKKRRSEGTRPRKPGGDPGPVRGVKNSTDSHKQAYRQQQDTYRPRHTRSSNTPRAPSGPERIYLSEGSPPGSGDFAPGSPDTSQTGTGYWPLGHTWGVPGPKMALRWPQDGPKMVQDGPKTGPRGSKMGPLAQHSPRMAPGWSQESLGTF